MPFATTPQAEPVTRRDRRRIAAVAVAIALVLAAIGVWAAVRPGSYGSSKDGCVTVTLPSSTGGTQLHQCGGAARTLCKKAYSSTDKVARLTRPQCRLAGITPAQLAAAS